MKLNLPERAVPVIEDATVHYDDQVLITRTDAWTAVRVPLQPYAFRSHDDQHALGWASTLSLGALKAGDVRFKVVRRPFSPEAFVRATDDAAQRNGTPSPHWPEWLAGQAARMAERHPVNKEVVIFRRLGQRSAVAQMRERTLTAQAVRKHLPFPAVAAHELAHWHEEADAVRSVLARGAYRAQPVTAADLRWYRRHALYRGLVPPEPSVTGRTRWGREQIVDEFADVQLTPLATAVRIDSPAGTVYTTTLTMSVFPETMTFPDMPPWLAHLDRVSPVWAEADVHASLIPPHVAKRQVLGKLRLAQDQRNDAHSAGADLPLEVEQMAALGRELQYTIPSRRLPLAYGWARVRVDAPTLKELAHRVEHAKAEYANESSPHIDLTVQSGMTQLDLLVEGIPGMPQRVKSYRQRWTSETLACALPQAGSELGHGKGLYAGMTTGRTVQSVVLDLHSSITRRTESDIEGPGGVVLLGAQRAGKSGALVQIIADGNEQGKTSVVVDFSGPIARAADLPRFAGRMQVLDVAKTGGGILDPMSPAVIPGDGQVNRAVREKRKTLTRDTLSVLVAQQLKTLPEAETQLLRAISEVAVEKHPSTAAVIARLARSRAKDAQALAEHFEFILGSDEASSLVGEGERVEFQDEPITRIITARGVALPQAGKSRDQWAPSEALGAAMFGVAANLAHRLQWDLPPHLLKYLIFDEAHIAMGLEQGRRVIELALRDGPKHGCAVILATHNAADLADERITNAIATKFQFRSTSPAELERGFAITGIEDTPANRRRIRGLRNGECIAVDDRDVRDRFRWDQWDAELAVVQNTTPTGDLA